MANKSDKKGTDPFRTEVVPKLLSPPIRYADPVMLIGSCFTEHVGNRMNIFKFNTDLNPFGIVYNPASVAAQINRLMNPEPYTIDSLVIHLDLWHSPDHHGRFSHPSAGICIREINEQLVKSSCFLRKAKFLLITLGSARAYYFKDSNRLAANCHQMPGDKFVSRMLEVEEIVRNFADVLQKLIARTPEIRIIFNVSPVRYWKYGYFDNQVSKATLILAIRRLTETFREVAYFPSYELFMDDLRDYRFYETDLLHPGAAGVNYVWDKFCQACFDRKTRQVMIEVESLLKACGHRSKGFNTPSHLGFLEQNLKKAHDLQARYPDLDFRREIQFFTPGDQSDDS